jgi:hypothetical protein
MKQFKPCANFAQDFTDSEKAQARANIGAAGTSTATYSNDGLMSSSDKLKLDTLTPLSTKYWMWDVGGDVQLGTWNDSQWSTINGGSLTDVFLVPNMTNSSGRHIHTNFTNNDPEAFPYSTGSSGIILKKGLWSYRMLIELEVTTPGTGVTVMEFWTRSQREGAANYNFVRPMYAPISNAIETKYTRTLEGFVYIDVDPVKRDGDWVTYQTLRFAAIAPTSDAVYRMRQQSFQLCRISK